jgi:hypothetical protein
MKKLVTVEYRYEGIVMESEIERGVLFGDKVLVTGNGRQIGLYKAQATALADVYLVDLDQDDRDYLVSSEMLLDLVVS